MQTPIWFNPAIRADDLAILMPNTLGEHLGMAFEAIGPNFLTISMPVDHRTHQPFGLLHGGASVALAETVGSVAAQLTVDSNERMCVGLDINANHVRGVREGKVFGTARPLHLGSTTQVWEIRVTHQSVDGPLVCVSRLTMSVLQRKGKLKAGV